MSFEVLVIIVLVTINGLLAMSEIAMVSARKSLLHKRAETGSTGARVALKLLAAPSQFLSTVQIGITLIGVLAGAFGGATIARTLAEWLDGFPAVAPYSQTISIAIVVVCITYLTLIVGELVPKRLALQHPDLIATRVAQPLQLFARLARPAVWLLSVSTDAALRLVGGRPTSEPRLSQEEIALILREGAQVGVLGHSEHRMVTSILRLRERHVGELMTPQHRIVYIDANESDEENRRRMAESPHTAFPVRQGPLGDVIGMVSLRELWNRTKPGAEMDMDSILTPPLFIPETASVLSVLDKFKTSGVHRALVVDEYGAIQGIFTVNDVLEAIVGDLDPENGYGEPSIIERADGSWLIDGMATLEQVNEVLGVEELPSAAPGGYRTLGGFMMAQFGRVPKAADHFETVGLRFEVMDMDGNRVDKVLVERLGGESPMNEQVN